MCVADVCFQNSKRGAGVKHFNGGDVRANGLQMAAQTGSRDGPPRGTLCQGCRHAMRMDVVAICGCRVCLGVCVCLCVLVCVCVCLCVGKC
jgi:hypothetical protein